MKREDVSSSSAKVRPGGQVAPRGERRGDGGTFYRVRAKHLGYDRWAVGELGDGFSDEEVARKYAEDCRTGGWPVVQLERVTVEVLETDDSALSEPQ